MMPQGADDMTNLVGVGIETLVRNAARLGLTWRLRLGTVQENEGASANFLAVRMDGDDQVIPVTSMIGAHAADTRVYVITVPPAGNYAVGWVSGEAPRYPGQRIATTTLLVDSVAFTTTETVIATVIGHLIEGLTYRVIFDAGFQITVDGVLRLSIREDALAGTAVQIRDYWIDASGGVNGGRMEVLYTALATGSKTFVATGDVLLGAGSCSINASANFPAYFYIEYVEG